MPDGNVHANIPSHLSDHLSDFPVSFCIRVYGRSSHQEVLCKF